LNIKFVLERSYLYPILSMFLGRYSHSHQFGIRHPIRAVACVLVTVYNLISSSVQACFVAMVLSKRFQMEEKKKGGKKRRQQALFIPHSPQVNPKRKKKNANMMLPYTPTNNTKENHGQTNDHEDLS